MTWGLSRIQIFVCALAVASDVIPKQEHTATLRLQQQADSGTGVMAKRMTLTSAATGPSCTRLMGFQVSGRENRRLLSHTLEEYFRTSGMPNCPHPMLEHKSCNDATTTWRMRWSRERGAGQEEEEEEEQAVAVAVAATAAAAVVVVVGAAAAAAAAAAEAAATAAGVVVVVVGGIIKPSP